MFAGSDTHLVRASSSLMTGHSSLKTLDMLLGINIHKCSPLKYPSLQYSNINMRTWSPNYIVHEHANTKPLHKNRGYLEVLSTKSWIQQRDINMHSTSQRKQSSTEHMCGLTYLSTGVFPAPTTVTAGHNKTIDSQVSTYLLISTLQVKINLPGCTVCFSKL